MSDQTKRFIERLTGDVNANVHWQIYHDSDKTKKEFAKSIYGTYDQSEGVLQRFQREGCGAYITINETDGVARTSNNVKLCRAIFIDGDNQTLPAHWGCYPSMIIARSNTQWHAYWFIQHTNDFESWKKLQYKIALYYGVKDRLHDLPRVMRAPGFYHLKDRNHAQLYKITYDNPTNYDIASLDATHVLDANKQRELDDWLSAPKAITNTVDVICESDVNIKRFNSKLMSISPEEGSYNNQLYVAAASGKDLGLSADTVKDMLAKWWSECWPIPVEPKTIDVVVNNAYQYGLNSVGAHTSAAKFSAAPPVDDVGSDEDLRVVIDGVSSSDIKYCKNHTVNARIFNQLELDAGRRYATYQQEHYVYEKTHWRKMKPKELDKRVLDSMLQSRPTADTISSTIKVLSLLNMVDNLESVPGWLTDNHDRDPKNLIAFRNGILDISDDAWLPHTSELFYTFCLDYDYDPTATCHKWVRYLTQDVFNGDRSLVQILQEWFGYQLVTSYDYQKIALFLGAPRSGKGTITNVMRHIVGRKNVASPTLNGLVKDSIIHSMSDKPVAIIGDAHNVAHNNRNTVLEILLMISGADEITYDRKHISASTTNIPSRFTMCANEFPEFLDSSGALVSRLLIFPFRNSYIGKEDPQLLQKLLTESAGILNWALVGLKRLMLQQKFSVSEDTVEMMRLLKEDLSPVAAFLSDCVHISGYETDIIIASDLFNIYKRWCDVNEKKPVSAQKFRKQLLSSNYAVKFIRKDVVGAGRPGCYTGLYMINDLMNVSAFKFPPVHQSKA